MSERRIVRSINVASAVKMTFVLVVSLWAILLIGFIALYLLGLVSGGLGGIEGFIASLGFTGFSFTILPFTAAFIVVGLLFGALLGMLAGVGAMLYNTIVPLVGGVEYDSRSR